MAKERNILVEKRNSEFFLRPRFTIDLDENDKAIIQKFSTALKKEDCPFFGRIVGEHVFINIPKEDSHFWSPQLHLEILEKTEKSSLLKGLFSPKPQVWTFFMFIHFIIGISFLGFATMLYTKISLQNSIFFPLIMTILLPLIWIILYFLGKIGKNTGKHQMRKLHNFIIDVINN